MRWQHPQALGVLAYWSRAGGLKEPLKAEEHVADALEGKSKAVFLVVQWLQFHIAMQGARAPSLNGIELDPTYCN